MDDIDSEIYSHSFRNRMLILKAIDGLLAEKPLDKISVKEICERSSVSRSMFYMHFNNKIAALTWYLHLCMDKGVSKIGLSLNWFEGHLATTRAFADYRNACYCALSSALGAELLSFFYDIRKNALLKALDAHNVPLTPKLEFQVEALIAGELAATRAMFSRTSVKELARYLTDIVPRDLYDALNKPISSRRH